MNATLDELIAKEIHRRSRMARKRQHYREWQQNGGWIPPDNEVWCDYCKGFYDRPHTQHTSDGYCPNVSKALTGKKVCDCLDCTCAEKIGGATSLQSRITQA